MKMNFLLGVPMLVQACFLFSCSGPRNIYSSSPLISPVPLEKGASAVETSYFTHTLPGNIRDSLGGRDYCFGLNLSHMVGKRTLLFAFADVKNEKQLIFNSMDPEANLHDNAGFDSSVISGKRHSWGWGIERFSSGHGKITESFAASSGYTSFTLEESGLLLQAPYRRRYQAHQLSFSLQGNFLYTISQRFRLAWTGRMGLLYSFRPRTDYTDVEKYDAGLHDEKVKLFLCVFGLYGDLRPFKQVPLTLTAQFFNDLAFWDHALARYDLSRTYIKGTGISLALKFAITCRHDQNGTPRPRE